MNSILLSLNQGYHGKAKWDIFIYFIRVNHAYLNVSRIIVNNTNFPSNGTTSEVGGMISANSKKNTVNESRMDMLNDTCKQKLQRK